MRSVLGVSDRLVGTATGSALVWVMVIVMVLDWVLEWVGVSVATGSGSGDELVAYVAAWGAPVVNLIVALAWFWNEDKREMVKERYRCVISVIMQ